MLGLSKRLGRISLRLRLALVFAGVMAVLLGAVGQFVYNRFESSLNDALNQQLRARAAEVFALTRGGTEPNGDRLGDDIHGLVQIVTPAGAILASRPADAQPLLPHAELRRGLERGRLIQLGSRIRLYARAVDRGRRVIVVGEWLGQHQRALETLEAVLLLGGPLALLLASVAGYLLAAASLRPVASMRRRAATIRSDDLDARLPLPDSADEIHRLGITLNEMLDRLQRGLERERAFVADASHELRSPLSVLKAELEVALIEAGDAEDLRESVRSAIEETDRIIDLAERLLVLASAEHGHLSREPRVVDTSGLLETVAERFSSRARLSGRGLSIHADDAAWVRADPARIEQALGNLIENALGHGAGEITIEQRNRGTQVELHVSDHGVGFPPAFLPRAFDRFTRADRSRPRGGTGLGLALVEAIARAHNGTVSAVNGPDGGADIWITLPAVAPPTGSRPGRVAEPVHE